MITKENLDKLRKAVEDSRAELRKNIDETDKLETQCGEIIERNGGNGSINIKDDHDLLTKLTNSIFDKYKEREQLASEEKEANKIYYDAVFNFIIQN